MTARRHRVRQWLARRVTAAYAGMPERTTCEALGGPCDGRRWTMPRTTAPIWLAGARGEHHLYVPSTRPADRAGVTRYRYAVSSIAPLNPPVVAGRGAG